MDHRKLHWSYEAQDIHIWVLIHIYIYIYITSKGPAGESPISAIIAKLPYFHDGPVLLGNSILGNGLYLK